MKGPLAPVQLLPRFSSFVGDGSYATAPLEVEAFDAGVVTFWRGPLVGGAALSPFTVYVEQSHDANTWSTVSGGGPITTANTVGDYLLLLTKRWLRVRVELVGDLNGVVAISLYMTGNLRRRVPLEA